MSELKNLYDLWKRLLGETPEPDQFIYWTAHFSDEVIRYAIQRTAAKNLKLTMTQLHRERLATKIMRARMKGLQRVAAIKARQESGVPSLTPTGNPPVNPPTNGQANQETRQREC